MKNKRKTIIILSTVLFLFLLVVGIFYVKKHFYEDKKDTTDDNKVENRIISDAKLIKVADYKNSPISSGWLVESNDLIFLTGDNRLTFGQTFNIYNSKGEDVTPSGLSNVNGTSEFIKDNKFVSSYVDNKSGYSLVGYYVSSNGKMGFVNSKGNLVLKMEFDDLSLINSNYIIVKKNDKYGVYSLDGKEVVPIEYDSIDNRPNDNGIDNYVIAVKNNKVGILDLANPTSISLNYESTKKHSVECDCPYYVWGTFYKVNGNYYFILIKNGKYGVVDKNNKTIIDFKYDNINFNNYSNLFYIYNYVNKKIVSIEFYKLDGTKKTVSLPANLTSSPDQNIVESLTKNSFIFEDVSNKKIYYLNDNLELTTYDSVAYLLEPGMDNDYHRYFISNNFYIKDVNNKFVVYSLDNNKKINNEFAYFSTPYFNNDYESVNHYSLLLLCKNKDGEALSNCGMIDNDGKIVFDFNYKFEEKDFGNLLVTDNKKIGFTAGNLPAITDLCRYENIDLYNIDNKVTYSLNCSPYLSKSYRNVMLKNNQIIVAENIDNSNDLTYLYDIYNLKGEKVKIENKDNAKLILDLNHMSNNNMYFLTNKGIYKIDYSK